MKRFFPSILAAVLLMTGSVFGVDKSLAFVDVQEVFKRFYKTRLAQDQIRKQQQDIKFEREIMEEEIENMKETIEQLRKDARDDTLSEIVRESKRNLLEEKLVDLQKKEQEMIDFEKLRIKQLEQQNTRMSRKLFDEIREVIVVYAKKGGYSGVIDRSSEGRNGLQMVLYADTKTDITADVLAVLNEGREELLQDEDYGALE